MSKIIRHYTYLGTADKAQIEQELNAFVSHDRYLEGGGRLSGPIHWFNHICDDRDAAEEFLSAHDTGSYNQLAVQYREPLDTSAAERELAKKAEQLSNSIKEARSAACFTGLKSKFRECKACGSRIAVSYLSSAYCPVCHADMRSSSAIAKEEALCRRREKVYAAIREEQKRAGKKGRIMWLVKIEYHK